MGQSTNTELHSIHIKPEITRLLQSPNYDECNQDILKFSETESHGNFNCLTFRQHLTANES